MPEGRIAILVPRLERGDAVGHDALGMQATLQAQGREAEIFAPNWERGAGAKHVRGLYDFLQGANDVLIYHYTVYWQEALGLFRRAPGPRILKYHNVTPPEFFAPYHEAVALACERGRAGLADFAQAGAELYLGDSDYNRRELIAAGAPEERTGTLAPFHRAEEILKREADLDLLARLGPDPFRRTRNFLMVGRIAPNKGHRTLIESFALLMDATGADLRLVFAGRRDPGLSAYNEELDKLCRERGVEGYVLFTDRLSEAELKACYLAADALVLASEHEGFCVPLLEAMALRLPVVALARCAVPETAGNGALLLEDDDPALFAAGMNRILRDQELSGKLTEVGHRRFRDCFRRETIASGLRAALDRARANHGGN